MTQEHYVDKDVGYFSHTRRDIISMLPVMSGGRVLEIGCGRGHTLAEIKQKGFAAEVVGVELMSLPRTQFEMDAVDTYIVGNIETDSLALEDGSFDVVICGDVLEHLTDPWAAMQKIKRFVKPGGALVASVPNVREARTLFNLIIRGDFAYTEAGVLDRTHLRFFCKKNILSLLTGAGGQVERLSSDLKFKSNWRSRLDRLTFGWLQEFLVTQYLVVVRMG